MRMTRSRRLTVLPLLVGLSLLFFTGISFADPGGAETDGSVSPSEEATTTEEPTATETESPSSDTESQTPTDAGSSSPSDEPAPTTDGTTDGDDASNGSTTSEPPVTTAPDDAATGGSVGTGAGPASTSSAPALAFPSNATPRETPHGRIVAVKTADVDTVPESGADVTFTFEVRNETDLRFWIRSLEDDVFGSLVGDADCHVGTVLSAGATCTFTHTVWLEGPAGGEHVNTFQVGAEHFGWMLWAADSETVGFTQGQSGDAAIAIHKTAHRTTVPETGANVVFTFDVHNAGTRDLELTTLEDDVFGPLAGSEDCRVRTVLASGASCTFTHDAWIEGDAPGQHVNTVTVRAGVHGSTDSVSDTATETVGFTDVGSDGRLAVTKEADRETVPESGADVTFTFTVHNETALRFTITSLEDDVFGTLEGDADCQVGTVLDANASCSFTHTAWLEGEAPDEHVNTVVVTAEHFGWTLSARDTETVAFVEGTTSGEVRILKAADRATVPETGGTVTFLFTVQNLGGASFEITSLVDDVFGPLDGDADCGVGTTLAAGGSCSFEHTVHLDGVAPGSHVNTVTVEATVEGSDDILTDTATETVGFTTVDDDVLGGGGQAGDGDDATQVLGDAGGAADAGDTAFTGGEVVPFLVISGALLVLGLTLALVARRRTTG